VPVERDKVLQAAQKLVEKKRYDKALAEYQKLVEENPKDVRTLLKIGDLHLKLEQYVEAITTYEQVGQFYSQQGAALKAIAVYKQIREIVNKHVGHGDDRFGHIVPQLAELYVQAGHTSDALAAYDEVATRLQRAGRDRDAIEIFEKLIELDSANPLPQLRLAEAFVRLKDTDNAIMRFGAAANILVKGGRLGDALKVVERLLQHRPDVTFARMAAEIYLERNEANDAMAALTKLQLAFKEDPKDLDTLGLLARAFDQLEQPTKALEVMKEAARVAKDAGKAETFNAIIDALLERAPDDALVRQLDGQRMVVAPAPPPMEPEVAEADDIDIAAIESAEAEEVVIDEEPASVAPAPEQPVEADIIDEEVEAENILEQSMSETMSPVSMAPESGAVFELVPAAPRHASFDPIARAKQLIAMAEDLRVRRDYQQAVTFLQSAIQELPDARDVREKLFDVLIEAGDRVGAIEEMLIFARYLADQGDNEGAALILDELLLLEPGQPDATHMLAQLGYALTYEAGPEYTDEYGNPYPPQGSDPQQYADPYYGAGAYNFEDSSGAYARPEPPPGQGRVYGDRRHGPLTSDAPLPSYGIEEESAQFMDAPPSTRGLPLVPQAAPLPQNLQVSPTPAVPGVLPDPAAGVPSTYAPSRPGVASAHRRRPTPPPRNSYAFSQLDEDALEEVEFFARHGMFDQARAMLDDQLARLPNHPLILEKKREIEELAARALSDRESGTRALPRAAEPRPSEAAYDISASLDALDQLEMGGSLEATAPLPAQPQPVDVESMFEQFKAGVSEGAPSVPAQISESDAATHYDLGVAYKEMGLFTDAIAEFELASRDPGRECVCLSMIGMIYIQVGEVDAAIDAFMRGLQVRNKTREQEYALTYEVANAYEAQGLPEQALMFFQRLAAMNPGYADPRGSVSERMMALDPNQRTATRTVGGHYGTTDNVDDAFDDMMGRRKKK
jgi:tetratricopeptide (TPR) repeat protein